MTDPKCPVCSSSSNIVYSKEGEFYCGNCQNIEFMKKMTPIDLSEPKCPVCDPSLYTEACIQNFRFCEKHKSCLDLKKRCPLCDPKYYVVYGKCRECGRQCHPLLKDFPKKNILDIIRSIHKLLSKEFYETLFITRKYISKEEALEILPEDKQMAEFEERESKMTEQEIQDECMNAAMGSYDDPEKKYEGTILPYWSENPPVLRSYKMKPVPAASFPNQCPSCEINFEENGLQCAHCERLIKFPFGPIPHWIKISDRPMQIGDLVAFVYSKEEGICRNWDSIEKPTHYMLYPEPPHE